MVFVSALSGAMLSTVLILLDNWWWGDDFGLSIILTIPAAWLRSSLGNQYPVVSNAYVVNAILSATIFAIIAVFWQFSIKGDNEK